MTGDMARHAIAEGFKEFNDDENEIPLVGKTVREVIFLQRQWIKEEEEQEAEAEAMAEEAKAKEEALAAELRKAITLTVYDKGFTEGRYDDYPTYKMTYQNSSSKGIRAFQGTVVFQDLFGDKLMGVSPKISDPIKAGEKADWRGTSEYNQFDDEDRDLRNTKLKDMKIVWIPEKIIFSDGTTIPEEK